MGWIGHIQSKETFLVGRIKGKPLGIRKELLLGLAHIAKRNLPCLEWAEIFPTGITHAGNVEDIPKVMLAAFPLAGNFRPTANGLNVCPALAPWPLKVVGIAPPLIPHMLMGMLEGCRVV